MFCNYRRFTVGVGKKNENPLPPNKYRRIVTTVPPESPKNPTLSLIMSNSGVLTCRRDARFIYLRRLETQAAPIFSLHGLFEVSVS